MKQIVANPSRLFVDRPLHKRSIRVGTMPSLWMLTREDSDYTEAALRVFLLLCLILSLALTGREIAGGTPAQESTSHSLSIRAVVPCPSLPSVSFGAMIR